MTEDELQSDLKQTFRKAEQEGLRLAIRGRLIALLAIAIWYGLSRTLPVALQVMSVIAAFALLGMIHYAIIGSRHDRWWIKYLFITVDIVLLTAVLAFAPQSQGADVPQILAFRYNFDFLYLVLPVACFSFSPWMVIWSGGVICLCWWSAFLWVVDSMERTLDWSDMTFPPTAEEFIAVFLDPDFVGTGSRVQETLFLMVAAVVLAIVVHRARRIVWARAEADQDREMITRTFGQYVPEAVAKALIADRGVLTPKQQLATVLFVDIERFTSIAEPMEPARVIAMLSSFFDTVAGTIGRHNGVIIQFLGDGLMATFNAPLEDPEHAANGLRAALAIEAQVRETEFEGVRLKVRIGVDTGPIAAGSVGGSGRQAFTVYGDTVNLASRLEALNKDHGTRILVSESTAEASGQRIGLTEIGTVAVRGKQRPVKLFSPKPAT
jgi:class 3 adenylate cyclase